MEFVVFLEVAVLLVDVVQIIILHVPLPVVAVILVVVMMAAAEMMIHLGNLLGNLPLQLLILHV
jgi:hypothetical protein